jgi:hypothetical protein
MAVIAARASLAVQHESRGIQRVTEVLGVTPTESFEAGEPYARGSRTREHSHWALDSPVDGELEEQLRALLDRFLPHREALELLRREGYRLAWTCYVEECDGDGAVALSSDLLRDLGAVPVDLWIDSYADTPSTA